MRFEVIPEDSMVPSRLISGTIVQTVKVWMQRMMRSGGQLVWLRGNAKIFGCFAGDEECAEESDENHSSGKRMQCVTECSA